MSSAFFLPTADSPSQSRVTGGDTNLPPVIVIPPPRPKSAALTRSQSSASARLGEMPVSEIDLPSARVSSAAFGDRPLRTFRPTSNRIYAKAQAYTPAPLPAGLINPLTSLKTLGPLQITTELASDAVGAHSNSHIPTTPISTSYSSSSSFFSPSTANKLGNNGNVSITVSSTLAEAQQQAGLYANSGNIGGTLL
jgi:hypothetical protein